MRACERPPRHHPAAPRDGMRGGLHRQCRVALARKIRSYSDNSQLRISGTALGIVVETAA